jgi:hypothetical protein
MIPHLLAFGTHVARDVSLQGWNASRHGARNLGDCRAECPAFLYKGLICQDAALAPKPAAGLAHAIVFI